MGGGPHVKLWLLAAACLLLALVVRLRRTYSIIRVDGDSMAPTLVDGDRLLARRVLPADLRRDQIAVVDNPLIGGERFLIKRITALPGDAVPPEARGVIHDDRVPEGRLVLLGDNPHGSFDSRVFGFFPISDVHVVTIRRMAATQRRGEI
jgi:signal peptidase I